MDTSTHLGDIELSLKFARLTRRSTRGGFDKMFVTGWSRGGYFTVALANQQAVYPRHKRDIKGIIPVDFAFKTNKDDIRAWACCAAQSYTEIPDLSDGLPSYDTLGNPVDPFANKKGLLFTISAALASTDSEGNSPFFPPLIAEDGVTEVYLKNSDVFDVNFGASWFPWNVYINCWGLEDYHFMAVTPQMTVAPGGWIIEGFLKNHFPVPLPVMAPERDMSFSDRVYTLLLAFHISPYQSYGEQRESKIVMGDCGDGDLPYDDNLSEIKVPVLYVGAAGGSEAMGNAEYTLGLLGTPKDKKELLEVQLLPPAYANMDFGHADLYIGNEKTDPDDEESPTYAEALFWTPMLNWIENNSEKRKSEGKVKKAGRS